MTGYEQIWVIEDFLTALNVQYPNAALADITPTQLLKELALRRMTLVDYPLTEDPPDPYDVLLDVMAVVGEWSNPAPDRRSDDPHPH